MSAGVLATWPAVLHIGSHFLAVRNTSPAGASPGDHLQTGWNLWLFGHQLEHGHAPWRDPYSFQPELSRRVDFQGLVFGVPYWPLFVLFGAVLAWNVFTLAVLVGAGAAACAWLRALGLSRGAALVGGLVFALAPYRVAQSTGHLLGPISIFVPLALLAVEKRRSLVAGAAIAAIPLSGQVSLALGAVPFFAAYAFVRGRGLRDAVPGTAASLVAAELVRHYAIRGSLHEHGRSLEEVGAYSARWIGFLSRHGSGETFVFLGWLIPAVALVGLAFMLRERRYGLAGLLLAAVVVPVAMALGTHLPTYRLARHVVPGLKAERVPERLLPLACLALAAFVAFALDRPATWLVPIALLYVAADSHVRIYHATRADEGNAAYAAIRRAGPGRLLELPAFLPDVHLNSTYLYYDMTAQRERPAGYSTTVSRPAFSTVRKLQALNCGTWSRDVGRLDIRYVAVHRSFYALFVPHCLGPAAAALRGHGFRTLAADGDVTVWARNP